MGEIRVNTMTNNDIIYTFLHVPKTGGSYVGTVLDGATYNYSEHVVYIDTTKDVAHYPPSVTRLITEGVWYNFTKRDVAELVRPDVACFATVRNPFDWLVSYWHVAPQGYNVTTFDAFLHLIMERSTGWPCRKLLYFPFFADEFLVDYLLHQDNLDVELAKCASMTKELTYTKGLKVKVSESRLRIDYRTYYNDELMELVQATWGRELQLFGYNFDGRTEGILDTIISAKTKKNLTYSWDTDKLIFNGKEIVR